MYPFQSQIQRVAEELAEVNWDPLPDEHGEDHELHAAGQTCMRCHNEIKPDEDVRRNAKHEWVHENCPPAASQPDSE
jgi:hypothetical protein